ncbi:hypothetical protein ACJX0J_012050, partial [Zea mays]
FERWSKKESIIDNTPSLKMGIIFNNLTFQQFGKVVSITMKMKNANCLDKPGNVFHFLYVINEIGQPFVLAQITCSKQQLYTGYFHTHFVLAQIIGFKQQLYTGYFHTQSGYYIQDHLGVHTCH